MWFLRRVIAALLLPGFAVAASSAGVKVLIERQDAANGVPAFNFTNVPPPSRNDAGTQAEFTLVDGTADPNSGDLEVLHDGKLPNEEDDPSDNFFFGEGTDGGRLLVDLHSVIKVKQVNTYSCHPNTRAPQVYALYGSDGLSAKFEQRPARAAAPERCGWKRIAKVDTRVEHALQGGQYGVSVSATREVLGKYRYLLFVISCTENQNPFGNTFYSEIDVVDSDAKEPPLPVTAPARSPLARTFAAEGGKYQITIDPSGAPDLTAWAFNELAPVAQAWYPKIIKLLPSDGFQAPAAVTIDFKKSNLGYVAITRGSHITCTTGWFRQNLKGEARGCVVHELVHVVQHYGGGQPDRPGAEPCPTWLTEGIPDYIRWFIYEPETHGADIPANRIAEARYDNSYRISGNFLNWATEKYDKDLVPQLNVALREGRYSEGLWKTRTGHDLEELGAEWKLGLTARSQPRKPAP